MSTKMPAILMSSLPSITGASPSGEAPSPFDSYIQPTLGHGLRIWWAFYWRNTLIAIVLSFLLGFVVQILYSADVLSFGARAFILKAGPYALAILTSIFMIHYVVRKPFKAFRIGLLSIHGDSFGGEVEPTRSRTIRIWWAFMWRTTLYVIFLSIAASIALTFILGIGAAISPAAGKLVAQLVNTLLAGASSMFVIYSNILDEDIGQFRVSLLPVAWKGGMPPAAQAATSTALRNPTSAPAP